MLSVSSFAHPIRAWYGARSRRDPVSMWDQFSKKCLLAGIKGPVFILSMDCDTTRDIEVAWEVHEKLQAIGITPAYAVPGELLLEGVEVYRKISSTGASFINHGYKRHTTYRPETSTYESFYFYDQLSLHEIERDIDEGERALVETIGTRPTGFRTPHFGSFQKRRELKALHGTLAKRGYRFSTSTMPFQGFLHGPVFERDVWEIPISGCKDEPLTILDSWSFRFDSSLSRTPIEYEEQAAKLASMLEQGDPYLINLYVDPSQVFDWPGFFTAMSRFGQFAIDSYDRLLDGLSK